MTSIWSKASGLGKRGYQFRWPSGIGAAILLLVHHNENQIALTWVDYSTLFTVLTIPHIYLAHYVRSGNDKGLAFRQIKYDLFLAGWIAGSMDLSIIPCTIYSLSISTTYVATRGFNKLYRLLLIPLGVFFASWLQGFHFHFQSTSTMIALSLLYGIVHFTVLSYVSYLFAKHQYLGKKLIKEQKQEIDEKAEEILMQAEELKALNETLVTLNESLERRIDERTEDLKSKNKKLSEYAFINAHKLRAPVATILGLVQLFEYNKMFNKEGNEIVSHLKKATSDLDGVVREIRINLEKEDIADKSMVSYGGLTTDDSE